MTDLNYFQFRLMVGKCQLTAFFSRKNPFTDPQLPKPELSHNRIVNKTKEDGPVNSHEYDKKKGVGAGDATNTTEASEAEDAKPAGNLPLIFPGKGSIQ